jgi:hypothetical protein
MSPPDFAVRIKGEIMRTTIRPNDNEIAAYRAFCVEHRIALDGEAGEKNGELFGDFIGVKLDSDFTQETLEAAFTQLKGQLKFVSKMQTDADALARNLRPEEIDAYKVWVKGQKLLIGLDGSEEGYANVRSLLGWMRGNPVTQHNLDLALGNIINNPQFGRIYFKPQPKQDRSIGPGGKINHALVNRPQEGFMPRSQTNRTARQVAEDNRPKTETPIAPAFINVEYQAKAESLQGRTHGQTDQAKKLFIMVPGTSAIDWQQTLAARERFLNTQVPLIRR